MVDSTIPRTTVAAVTAIVVSGFVSRTNGFAHYIVAETETGKQILI